MGGTRLPPLSVTNPEVAAQWHPTLNETTPDLITRGAALKPWWQCSQGHVFEASISNRVRHVTRNPTSCPVCSNQILVPGINDLATLRPELALEWHPTKNGSLTPQDVFPRASTEVWWQCNKGHDWKVSPHGKEEKTCAFCSSQIFATGINDLATLYPNIASSWHPTKNGRLTPADVPPRYSKKVWWQCREGHEWETAPDVRVSLRGCAVCVNRKTVTGVNDLATTHPELAAQWHPIKNGNRTPYNTPKTSSFNVWWICPKGHEWQTTPNVRYDRNKKGTSYGCAVCSNKKVLEGFNDLATTHPELAAQWHPTKNGNLFPSMITAGSGRQVHWLCKKGHTWRTIPASRSGKLKTGCWKCAASASSRIETELYEKLKTQLPNLSRLKRIRHDKWDTKSRTMEVDMYLKTSEDTSIVIEYDGSYWHRNSTVKDTFKTELLFDAGCTVIRIRENNLHSLGINSAKYMEFSFTYDRNTEETQKLLVSQIVNWVKQQHLLTSSQVQL